jgi:pyroglutamyl-peptidase
MILLTGFEPFGDSYINPSEKIVKHLNGINIAGQDIHTLILPVDTFQAPVQLINALRQNEPAAVVCLGVALGRPAISIERLAVNLMDFRIPDNSGIQVMDQPIIEHGPAALFSTLPVRKIYEGLINRGIPAELSLSAGTYLCNQIMYCLLEYCSHLSSSLPGGFIHLPALPEQAALRQQPTPSMNFETMLQAVQISLAVVTNQLSN